MMTIKMASYPSVHSFMLIDRHTQYCDKSVTQLKVKGYSAITNKNLKQLDWTEKSHIITAKIITMCIFYFSCKSVAQRDMYVSRWED
jgi:hypothetical protein